MGMPSQTAKTLQILADKVQNDIARIANAVQGHKDCHEFRFPMPELQSMSFRLFLPLSLLGHALSPNHYEQIS